MKPWPRRAGLALLLTLLFLPGRAQAQAMEEIAGEYTDGPSAGLFTWRFTLRADGTFRSVFNDWEGMYGVNGEGRARLEGSRLLLELVDPPPALVRTGPPTALEIVRWGQRCYLIQQGSGPHFAAAIARGDEPRRQLLGRFLLRNGDWKLPAPGRPKVPQEWEGWLVRRPIEALITRQLAYHRAEIGAGSNSGVAAGMLLTLVSRKYGATEVRVVSTAAQAAVIENDYGDPPLSKGVRVTSKAR